MSSLNIIKEILESSNGKFVSVTFTKKDGSERVLTGRSGVKKYLSGGERTSNPDEYFIIHENGGGYRNIAYDKVTKIVIAGKELVIK